MALDIVPHKQCVRCKQTKPATREFFLFRKERNSFHSWCKSCINESKRLSRLDPVKRPKRLEKDKQYNQRRVDTPEKREAYKADARKRYHKNSTRILLRLKEKSKTPDFKERKRISDTLYRNTQNGKSVRKASETRRRARKRNLPNNFSKHDWIRCLEYFDNKCAVCGKSPDIWRLLSADHWIPLASLDNSNPGTVPENIVPLCNSRINGVQGDNYCNSRKQNTDPLVWLKREYGDKKGLRIYRRIMAYFEYVRSFKRNTAA